MINNERIAEWLGYVYVDQSIRQPFQDDGASGWRKGWHGPSVSIAFSTDITLWHGDSELLAIINSGANGALRWDKFINALVDVVYGPRGLLSLSSMEAIGLGLQARPPSLAAALVEMIKGEKS